MQDSAVGLDAVDSGQEEVPVQAVAVQVVGGAVGGGHHDEASPEHGPEQPRHDHGVPHIRHLELVEGQHIRLP